MKYVKMLGLAAVAAMAITALMGAGTASATTVCTEGGTVAPCASGRKPYEGEIAAHLVPGTKAILKGSITVECSTSEVKGTTDTAGVGQIKSATFTNCTGCSPVVSEAFPWPSHAVSNSPANGNGKLFVENPKVTLEKCLGGIATCRAKAKSVELAVTGGKPAKIVAAAVPLEIETVSGFGCGSTGSWKAEYETSVPSTGVWLD